MINKIKIYSAFMGLFLLIGLWGSIFEMRTYQLISLLIVGILYNLVYWSIPFEVEDGRN